MPFFQVDDHFHVSRKARALAARVLAGDLEGFAALGVWTMAGSACQDVGTDGVVSLQMLLSIGYDAVVMQKLAHRLVDAGLWHTAGHDCARCEPVPTADPESGIEMPCWRFHDWWALKYDKAEVVRETRAKRGELQNPAIVNAVWLRDCIDPTDPIRKGHALCRYCARLVKRNDKSSRNEDARPTIDHVDPYSAKGVRNLVVSCMGCNRSKGKRTPAEAGMTLLPAPRALTPAQEAAVDDAVSPDATSAAGTPSTPSTAASAPAGPKQRPPSTAPSSAPDHRSSTAPEVSSGARPGTRAGAGPGQGQGQGLGKGEGEGHQPGSPPAGRSRPRSRRRGRQGKPRAQPDPNDAGPAPDAPTVGQWGSPWHGYHGPPSPLGDENHCPEHHEPMPCNKCTRGETR